MSFINYQTKEINCKIVYYGPGLGGKTTNIQYVYEKTASPSKGEMVSLSTENERTLFFDFFHWTLVRSEVIKRDFIYIQCQDKFSMKLVVS